VAGHLDAFVLEDGPQGRGYSGLMPTIQQCVIRCPDSARPDSKDEALNPLHVYLFRAQRIMLKPDRIADTVEQFGLALAACPWNARRHALFYAGLPRKRKK
jgi:hypothetical protein